MGGADGGFCQLDAFTGNVDSEKQNVESRIEVQSLALLLRMALRI